MKKILIIPFFIIIISFISSVDCGNERVDIKTLNDTASKRINWIPKRSSVSDLAKLVQPFPVDYKSKKKGVIPFDKTKRFGYEFSCFQIDCKIREYRREEDGDYHLVLMDMNDTTVTIIGEIVNPECDIVKNSQYINSFKDARAEFEKYKLPNHKVQSGRYTLIGICFFDFIHGQLGVAPNGIELHPIMDFQKRFN